MGLSQEQQIMQVEKALKDQLNSLKFDIFDVVRLTSVNDEWQIFLGSTEDTSQDFRYGTGETIVEALQEAKQHVEAEKQELNQEKLEC